MELSLLGEKPKLRDAPMIVISIFRKIRNMVQREAKFRNIWAENFAELKKNLN